MVIISAAYTRIDAIFGQTVWCLVSSIYIYLDHSTKINGLTNIPIITHRWFSLSLKSGQPLINSHLCPKVNAIICFSRGVKRLRIIIVSFDMTNIHMSEYKKKSKPRIVY